MRARFSVMLMILVLAGASWAGGKAADQPGKALLQALDDERAARATYEAVIDKLGEVRPFSNIVHAEQRHEDHLMPLFEKYGVAVPEAASSDTAVEVPATRTEACRQAVEAERSNVGLYDELLAAVEQADVRETFEMLRARSLERHLPAFERCAEGAGGGQRHGKGGKHGMGAGKGKGQRAADDGGGFGCSRGGGKKGCCGQCG